MYLKRILFFILLLFPLLSPAQKRTAYTYIPGGTFNMSSLNGGTATISVTSFYLTNEVTNKEYREFVTYLREHPNDSLRRIDYSPKEGTILEFGYSPGFKIVSMSNSQLLKNIIDTSWYGSDEMKMYPDYFSNRKFDDHPVVGVSFENAKWYCEWRSIQDNKKKKRNQPDVYWSLPNEASWMYIAQVTDSSACPGGLHSVKKEKTNRSEPGNLGGNVAEWCTDIPTGFEEGRWVILRPEERMVIGGSFKTGCSLKHRVYVDRATSNHYTGFRMIAIARSNDDEL